MAWVKPEQNKMSMWIKAKMAKIKLLSLKAKKEALKLSFAVVITEIVMVLVVSYALNQGILEWLEPRVISISNVAEAKEVKVIPEVPDKVESIEDIIKRVAKEKGFEDTELLLRIAECESGLDKYAKNDKSTARGLYQILDMHNLSEDERYNPETAIGWTIDKIRANGTKAWNASKSCWNK